MAKKKTGPRKGSVLDELKDKFSRLPEEDRRAVRWLLVLVIDIHFQARMRAQDAGNVTEREWDAGEPRQSPRERLGWLKEWFKHLADLVVDLTTGRVDEQTMPDGMDEAKLSLLPELEEMLSHLSEGERNPQKVLHSLMNRIEAEHPMEGTVFRMQVAGHNFKEIRAIIENNENIINVFSLFSRAHRYLGEYFEEAVNSGHLINYHDSLDPPGAEDPMRRQGQEQGLEPERKEHGPSSPPDLETDLSRAAIRPPVEKLITLEERESRILTDFSTLLEKDPKRAGRVFDRIEKLTQEQIGLEERRTLGLREAARRISDVRKINLTHKQLRKYYDKKLIGAPGAKGEPRFSLAECHAFIPPPPEKPGRKSKKSKSASKAP